MTTTAAVSFFSDFDIDLFKAGKHYQLFDKFGAHITKHENTEGVYFAVWAPSASKVSVIGDFNFWNGEVNMLNVRWDSSGIWEGFIPNAKHGQRYKFQITNANNGVTLEKADPFALFAEHPPATASIIWDKEYFWNDELWMQIRKEKNGLDKPMSVYEVHLESWKYNSHTGKHLSYSELAIELVQYVKEMGYTHVELMPIMEYPYSPSWGYQITGYFAPSSRFGNPQEFRKLIDALHQAEIGVILDWVPAHFPSDAHGLGNFDGTHLYEHPDSKKGYHPDWKSLIFNYGRNEVRAFLISNAIYWLQHFHIDGLRIDAVASMLYLDYSRKEGEWEPNMFGGNHYLESIDFIKELNREVYTSFPDIQTIAEESTSFSMITKPVYLGGLGFGQKWMMGWMNDTLQYFSKDPVYRKYHQNNITFSLAYAFTENFMLPLSHDEVVHGKKSLLGRMPGDEWQKFANLRLLYSYMFTHPGTKLLFQGADFAQSEEWNFQQSLDWHLLQYDYHKQMQHCVKELNSIYKNHPALYEKAFSNDGFEWISYNDEQNSVIAYIRKGHYAENDLIVVCNFTPMVHYNYKIGVHQHQNWKEIFNSDAKRYGGSGVENKAIVVKAETAHHKTFSAEITLPPLACIVFAIEK